MYYITDKGRERFETVKLESDPLSLTNEYAVFSIVDEERLPYYHSKMDEVGRKIMDKEVKRLQKKGYIEYDKELVSSSYATDLGQV